MKKRILIVDDDRDHTDSVVSLLESEYDVEVASNGFSAIDRMRSSDFHLILLDMVMPGLDGAGFVKQLRAGNTFTPVLLITASRNAAPMAKTLGVEDYLTKPLDLSDLESKIGRILESQDPYLRFHKR